MADPREAGPRKISRRQFIFTAAETAAAALLAACAPTPSPDAPTSTSTAKATETPAPTQTPAPSATSTETPVPTEVPVEIVGVEVKSVAQNKEVMEKLQLIPIVHILTSGADFKRNERGMIIDMWGRPNMTDLIPAHTLITANTKVGPPQHIFVIRHPEQDQITGEIEQAVYLIVGRGSDSKYVDPSQAEARNVMSLPLTAQNGIWSFIDSETKSPTEFARITSQKGTVTSPFGGTFDFDPNDVRMFGLTGVLDYVNHPLLPLDLTYQLIDQTAITPGHALLGDQFDWGILIEKVSANVSKYAIKLPVIEGSKWVFGEQLYKTVQNYLEVQHPELVADVQRLRPQVSFERNKTNSNKFYWRYHWEPLDMPPIFRFTIFNANLPMVPGFDSIPISIEVIPDNSPRGWGMLNYIDMPREPYYAFTHNPMPHSLFSFLDDEHYPELLAAATQLTDPKDPNFGVISPIFSHNLILQGIPD